MCCVGYRILFLHGMTCGYYTRPCNLCHKFTSTPIPRYSTQLSFILQDNDHVIASTATHSSLQRINMHLPNRQRITLSLLIHNSIFLHSHDANSRSFLLDRRATTWAESRSANRGGGIRDLRRATTCDCRRWCSAWRSWHGDVLRRWRTHVCWKTGDGDALCDVVVGGRNDLQRTLERLLLVVMILTSMISSRGNSRFGMSAALQAIK